MEIQRKVKYEQELDRAFLAERKYSFRPQAGIITLP